MIVLEAVWLGLIGGLLGSGAGFVVAALIHTLHVELPPPPGAVDRMQLRLQFVAWDPVWVTLLMMAILALAAAIPAWRVLRLRIVEALNHV
jgi:ABC-type antimicrobial peptide transport system permease subunit